MKISVWGILFISSLTKAITIVIDPGHGGKFTGCHSASDKLLEKDVAFDIAMRLQKKLISHKYTVFLTRDADTNFCEDVQDDIQERIKFIKTKSPDFVISIHLNSAQSPTVRGFELYVPYEYDAKSYSLASCLHHQLAQKSEQFWSGNLGNLNLYDRGIRAAKFFLLRDLPCPRVLVELDYLSNPQVEKKFFCPEHINEMADILYQGILQWLRTKT
jgi:N-acetylmuramoyl-L-alanine amidase